MEHRQTRRYPFQLKVEVKSIWEEPRTVTTYNISEGGAFLDMNPWAIPLYSFVELKVLPDQHSARTLRVNGLIIHRTENGVGVMFADSDQAQEYRAADAEVKGIIDSEGERRVPD